MITLKKVGFNLIFIIKLIKIIAPFRGKYSIDTCLFRSGFVLMWISLVPYKYLPVYLYIGCGTYKIRIRMYVH